MSTTIINLIIYIIIKVLLFKVTRMQGLCFPTFCMVQLLQKGHTKLACDDGNKQPKRKYLYCIWYS